MKTILTTFILIISLFGSKTEERLLINTSESSIIWSCDYVFYFSGHHGTIEFQDGYFIKENGLITGGEFIIDMNSIVCLDIEDQEANESLVNHIKDPDFFDVVNFPKSKLSITSVKYHDKTSMEISANLEIKETIQPIKLHAKVDYQLKQMTTKFKIDRMRWGISYNSDVKDGAISDAIGYEVKLSL